ncbi:MAG: NAD(P)H-hydrate epimerase [Candidatus Omnitrophica bacterium]|nr:NAD(P)H-hydrate epimerase [Candidatus Omnitrophota bacterium]
MTAKQMQDIDQRAISDYGIPSLLLMENAGRGVAELIISMSSPNVVVGDQHSGFPPTPQGGYCVEACGNDKKVIVFCGKGNNGGDGLVAARHLHNRGFGVYVILLARPENLKEDPAVNFRILLKMKIPYLVAEENSTAEDFLPVIEKTDVVLDALFGVGLERPVTGVYAEAIKAINQAGRNVVAIDLPSGLHSDSGEVLGVAVKASMTATLAIPKQGLFQSRGPDLAGKICVVDIGLPKELAGA